MLNSTCLQWILYLLLRLLKIFPSLWKRRLTPRKTLLSLPNEVLCEILHYVDWRGLLAVKSVCGTCNLPGFTDHGPHKTCRCLYVMTKTCSLWHSRISELSLMPGVPVLEDAMEAYTVEELEESVIKRLRARDRLCHPDSTTFRSRVLNADPETFGNFHLLPGGRWLIDNIRGYVYVLDLDAPEQTRHFLFDATQYDEYNRPMDDPLAGSAIWIDSSQPRLSIRIVLHNTTTAHYLGKFQNHCIPY
ncbi:hypothetical protein P691DRAFT_687769 [Macrolepiota fuliginosa MF-IS2]|uniref:F-box domain-containing protein n=1 Tax=Macrolepiota fuliginosa MF-IS2 TaxID=1400762 RepID=A0A9P6BWG4_9AGAR|nr:hypothetical protein P691DRAFT_687769 [Macrolepiota fuliginosa MF-IS2]